MESNETYLERKRKMLHLSPSISRFVIPDLLNLSEFDLTKNLQLCEKAFP